MFRGRSDAEDVLAVILAFVVGSAAASLLTGDKQPSWARSIKWDLVIRCQLLAVAVCLSFFAAWRVKGFSDIVAPAAIEATGWLCFGVVVLLWRRQRSLGGLALDHWALNVNTSFYVIPIASVILGPAAVGIVTLADRLGVVRATTAMVFLRRDAPVAQKTRTAAIDHAPALMFAVGLGARFVAPAPDWTSYVLTAAGPVLALTGAFLYFSSVRLLPKTSLSKHEAASGVRRWLFLWCVRAVSLSAVASLIGDRLVSAVVILSVFSAPPFQPSQLALLFGYRSSVLNAVRWAWLMAPFGALFTWLFVR